MGVLVVAIIAVLAALAALHLYWGLGGHWPGRNAAELAAMVVGTTRRAPPGFGACAVVAVALSFAAYIVAVRHGAQRLAIPDAVWMAGYWGVFAVFLLRGLTTYIPGIFSYAKSTSFFALNRRFYGPLCLSIAAAMAVATLG